MYDVTSDDWSLDGFVRTIHQGGVALWSWAPAEKRVQLDALARQFWGGLDSDVQPLSALFRRIDARDREEAAARWWQSAEAPGPYAFDFRIAHGGEERWISARGVGGDGGRQGGWVRAIFVDTTQEHQAEEAQRRLASEMAHRLANLFAVAGALTAAAAREAETVSDLVGELRSRFADLHTAANLAMRGAVDSKGRVGLADVTAALLAAYDRDGAAVTVDIPGDVTIEGDTVTNYALIIHELATNAAKYGAFAQPGGRLDVDARRDGERIALCWQEKGCVLSEAGDGPAGFGSRLLDQTVASMDGALARSLSADGLTVRFTVPSAA